MVYVNIIQASLVFLTGTAKIVLVEAFKYALSWTMPIIALALVGVGLMYLFNYLMKKMQEAATKPLVDAVNAVQEKTDAVKQTVTNIATGVEAVYVQSAELAAQGIETIIEGCEALDNAMDAVVENFAEEAANVFLGSANAVIDGVGFLAEKCVAANHAVDEAIENFSEVAANHINMLIEKAPTVINSILGVFDPNERMPERMMRRVSELLTQPHTQKQKTTINVEKTVQYTAMLVCTLNRQAAEKARQQQAQKMARRMLTEAEKKFTKELGTLVDEFLVEYAESKNAKTLSASLSVESLDSIPPSPQFCRQTK